MSIRARIALLSGLLTFVILLGIGVGVYFILQRSLNQEVDSRLTNVVVNVAENSTVGPTADGSLAVALPRLDPFASPGLYIQATDVNGAGKSRRRILTNNISLFRRMCSSKT